MASSTTTLSFVDCLTSDLFLGRQLGRYFFPHQLLSFAHLSLAFHRWAISNIAAHDQRERQRWQTARQQLMEERQAVRAARAALSEEEALEVDEQLHLAWDALTTPAVYEEDMQGYSHAERPSLPAATELLHRMRGLVKAGAVLQSKSQRRRRVQEHWTNFVSTCDAYRQLLLLDGLLQRGGQWSAEEAEMVAGLVDTLRLVWTSNPRLMGDSTYLSGGVHMPLLRILFEPVLQRCTAEDGWELQVTSQAQADVLFTLCTTAVLHCHLGEEDSSILPDVHGEGRPEHEGTFNDLLYRFAAPFLVPHRHSEGGLGAKTICSVGLAQQHRAGELFDYTPISELHRHQQLTLTRLLLNHYGTAEHGLSTAADDQLTPTQREIRRVCRHRLLPCVDNHLDTDVRPDVARLWQAYTLAECGHHLPDYYRVT